jgi:UDP-N-acetylmuramate--alanine ligase
MNATAIEKNSEATTHARVSERLGTCGRVQVTPAHLFPTSGIAREELAEMKGRRIHFMGAGGIGVSALMELCAARGAIVTGCDCGEGGQVPALRNKGILVLKGHCASHAADFDELVCSAAIAPTHPEVVEAKRLGKPVHWRMAMLGRIAKGTRSICVTGAHGKTTTTWLIARLLIHAQRDPSVLLGGVVAGLNGNVQTGQGCEFVAEVDESDNRLNEVVPTIPVLTNIDNDHLDHYGTVENIEAAMVRFLASVDTRDPLSVLIGCGEDRRVRHALQTAAVRCKRPVITYGFTPNNQVVALKLRSEGLGWRFDALTPEGVWSDLELPMPGQHNVLNALAAISVAFQLGIPESAVRSALANCERVARRFEIKGERKGVRIIDDYGHHPTEIEVTLRAARTSTRKRLGVLFQPHRYSRTAQLMDQFASCFSAADKLFLMPIYGAGETPIAGVDHVMLSKRVKEQSGIEVELCDTRADAVERLAAWAQAGDTVITQGAGDVTRAGDELVSRL